MYFTNHPTIAFRYGETEYISTTDPTFAVNDQVFWIISNLENPLEGCIEFIGKDTVGFPREAIAIVKWNQPTCHLPGHISNPEPNRNLVPLNELIKHGREEYILDVVSSSTQTEVIGWCFAKKLGIEQKAVTIVRIGSTISIQTNSKTIKGTLEVVCTLSPQGNDTTYAGTKLTQSASLLFPAIRVKHLRDNAKCSECESKKLIYIPTEHIRIINRGKVDQVPTWAHEDRPPTAETFSSEETAFDIPHESINKNEWFIGNCVAKTVKLETCTVQGVKVGKQIIAEGNGKSICGEVKLICQFKSSENFHENCYVGVYFTESFGNVCCVDNEVAHIDLRGRNPSTCVRCDRGKLVFILAELLLNPQPISGISFTLH